MTTTTEQQQQQQQQRVRLVAIDMDGTLLNHQKTLPEFNKVALRKAAEKGVHIALASGRMAALLTPFEEELAFGCFLVGWNGACVMDTKVTFVASNWIASDLSIWLIVVEWLSLIEMVADIDVYVDPFIEDV